jgi:hypothetical protein
MHETDDPNLPPPRLLRALRRPRVYYMIDDPSPFEPLSVWKEHLRDLSKMDDQRHPQVKRSIEDARETIRWIKERESMWLAAERPRCNPSPTLPAPAVLEALREPRRVQLHDPAVRTLLAKWKKRGYYDPVEYLDLWHVAEILGVKNPKAPTRRRIVEAVEAAGIKINNLDGWRRSMAERGINPSLSGYGAARLLAESQWRWPERWDKDMQRQRRTCVLVQRGRLQYILKRKALKAGDEVLPWEDDEEVWM